MTKLTEHQLIDTTVEIADIVIPYAAGAIITNAHIKECSDTCAKIEAFLSNQELDGSEDAKILAEKFLAHK